jgi:hypothetical protein
MTMKNLSVSHLKRRVACPFVVTIAVFLGPTTMAQEAAVEDVIEAFYEAAGNGDMDAAARLTHVDAKFFGARNDKLMQIPLTLWPARSGVDMDTVEIGDAHVAGAAAMVEVRREAGEESLVELVSLVRFNGAWRVMSIVQGVVGS